MQDYFCVVQRGMTENISEGLAGSGRPGIALKTRRVVTSCLIGDGDAIGAVWS